MANVTSQQGTGFLGHAPQMFKTHPLGARGDTTAIIECIQACLDCAQACVSCADACLGEENASELARCIRLNQDCADLCEVTARVLSRQTHTEASILRAAVEACAVACRACGEECTKHGQHMEHCRICAEACQACEKACRTMVSSVRA